MVDPTGLQASLDRAKTLRSVVVSRLETVRQDISRLEMVGTLLDAVGIFFRQLLDQEVTTGVKAVEQLQTEGLQAVFDDDLMVRAQVEVQRGKVSVEMITVQKHADGTEIEGLGNDAFGGAVTTVQSVLLRLIIVLRRGLRPILLLDESLPALDSNYATNMGLFLSTLCKRLGMDILLVSHSPVMVEAADRAYRIVKKNGHAKFELMR